MQDEITDAIVAAIEPQVYAAENFRASRQPPESLDAWDLVMRGLGHFWKVTQQDNLAAQALFERAIAIDPHYGQALGLLALSYVFGTHMGWKEDRAETLSAAERAALAAVRADSEDACAHLALAAVYVNLGRLDDSLAEFELSLRLNRNMSLAQGLYGLVLSAYGRWKEGRAAARRALRLSPRGPLTAIYNGIVAHTEFVGCNYDEAIRQARESVRHRFDLVGAHRILTAAAGMAGEIEIAEDRAQGFAPRAAQYLACVGRAPHAGQAACRAGALSGRLPPRRPDVVRSANPDHGLEWFIVAPSWQAALFHLQPELMDELAPFLFLPIDVVGVFGRRRDQRVAAFEMDAFLHLRIASELAQLGAEGFDDLRRGALRRQQPVMQHGLEARHARLVEGRHVGQ